MAWNKFYIFRKKDKLQRSHRTAHVKKITRKDMIITCEFLVGFVDVNMEQFLEKGRNRSVDGHKR